eukprot:27999-Pyramimonas_sp.AAC.1
MANVARHGPTGAGCQTIGLRGGGAGGPTLEGQRMRSLGHADVDGGEAAERAEEPEKVHMAG